MELRQPGRRRLRPRLPATAAVLSAHGASGTVPTPGIPSVASHPLPAASNWNASFVESTPGEDWNVEYIAYERQRLIDALNEADGNKSEAARLLGMPRSTFFSKVKKYGIV
jgi:transcriptional regulator of acetoin/glycerol metabolism